jgi:hypothetical protein
MMNDILSDGLPRRHVHLQLNTISVHGKHPFGCTTTVQGPQFEVATLLNRAHTINKEGN